MTNTSVFFMSILGLIVSQYTLICSMMQQYLQINLKNIATVNLHLKNWNHMGFTTVTDWFGALIPFLPASTKKCFFNNPNLVSLQAGASMRTLSDHRSNK